MGLKLQTLKAAEVAAHVMRSIGLGAVVDRLTPGIAGALERQVIEFDGLTIECSEMGHVAYMRDLVDGSHDRYFRELLVAALPPTGVMVDGGAHLGLMALVGARCVGKGGQVHAFEPNPNTLPILRRNISRNGFSETITVHPIGLSNIPGTAPFYVSADGGNTSSLHDSMDKSRPAVHVLLDTGDAQLADVDVVHAIKLDIEGHEVSALSGLKQVIARSSDHLTLFVECNPHALAAAGATVDDLFAAIQSLGLSYGWIDEEARCIRPVDGTMFYNGYANLVCRRR